MTRDSPAIDDCIFCIRAAGDPVAAFADSFPVSDGHTLVVPGRHVERLEALDQRTWDAVFRMVREVARDLAHRPGVDGINIGVNSGAAAGQTVEHAHVHVIPRRRGDVPDPRGGVRWVLPSHAPYWNER